MSAHPTSSARTKRATAPSTSSSTAFTSPICSARSASNTSPVSSSSRAAAGATRCSTGTREHRGDQPDPDLGEGEGRRRAPRPRCRRRPAARCRRRGPDRGRRRPPASGSRRSAAGSPAAHGPPRDRARRLLPPSGPCRSRTPARRGPAPPPGPPDPLPPPSSAVVSAARTAADNAFRLAGESRVIVATPSATSKRTSSGSGPPRAGSVTDDRPSGPPDWVRLNGCHPPCPRATRYPPTGRCRIRRTPGWPTAACRSTCTCRSARPAAATATSTPTPPANWARPRPRSPGWTPRSPRSTWRQRFSRAGGDQRAVSTVFVGGGTPSLVGAGPLTALLDAVRDRFGLAPDAEVTTEANPESTDPELLAGAAGRRLHPAVARHAVHLARGCCRSWTARTPPAARWTSSAGPGTAGFEHVNLDLIYGTPGETDAEFADSLRAAVGSGVDHVSAYSLIVEPGTRLARQVRTGALPMPDDDVLADRYLLADADADRGRVLLVRGLELGAGRAGPLPAQPGVLDRRRLVGDRAGRALARRRRAVVERQAPGGVRGRAGRRRAAPVTPARCSTPEARRLEDILLRLRLADGLDTDLLDPTGRGEARGSRGRRTAGAGPAEPGTGRADPARPAAGRRPRAPAGGLIDSGRLVAPVVSRGTPTAVTVSRSAALAGDRVGLEIDLARPGAQRVQVQDPDVDDGPLLQGGPQRPVQAVLQVDLALPAAPRARTGRRRRWSPRPAARPAAVRAWW